MTSASMNRPRSRVATAAGLVTCLLFGAAAAGVAATGDASADRGPRPTRVAPADCAGSHWVGVWSASPSDASSVGSAPLAGRTIRTVVTPLGSGSTVRVRFSNRLGSTPFLIRAATVAEQGTGSGIRAGTVRGLTFDGRRRVTIRAGAAVVSDPARLLFRALGHLAVTTYIDPGSTGLPTKHFDGRQTSYLTPRGAGDHTADAAGGAFTTTTTARFLVSGIETRAPRSVSSVVAFGDSITDGYQDPGSGSLGIDRDVRYPDFLARRLAPASGAQRLTVLNAGVGGNRIRRGPKSPTFGPSGLSRLGPDVIGQAGVDDVIVLEGINDILQSNATAPAVIGGLSRVVRRLKAAGLRVLLGTLTPTGGFPLGAANQQARLAVNGWIRRQTLADGVIDFDRALRDPGRPIRLLAPYDSGDHLHPSAGGYRAMAAAVPLSELGTRCAAR